MEEIILELIEEKKYGRLRETLSEMNPADIALIFEEIPDRDKSVVFRVLPKELAAEVFVEMDSIENLGVIINHLKEQKINLFDIDLDKVQRGNFECINALMGMYLPRRVPHAAVIASISTLEGVISIEEV